MAGATRWSARPTRRAGRPRSAVSPEGGRRDYGVVIAGEAVDEQATEELRARLREERGEPAQFDYGVLPEGVTVG